MHVCVHVERPKGKVTCLHLLLSMLFLEQDLELAALGLFWLFLLVMIIQEDQIPLAFYLGGEIQLRPPLFFLLVFQDKISL